MKHMRVLFLMALVVVLTGDVKSEIVSDEKRLLSTELVSEGRTFVHHTIKRLAVILPAVFFKLGIAFSLLLLVAIVTVNNSFIGFLLLILGVSTVLARLQEARRPLLPAPLSYPAPLPLVRLGHHHHFLDRSDDTPKAEEVKPTYTTANTQYPGYGTSVTPTYSYSGTYGSFVTPTYGNSDNYYGSPDVSVKYYAAKV